MKAQDERRRSRASSKSSSRSSKTRSKPPTPRRGTRSPSRARGTEPPSRTRSKSKRPSRDKSPRRRGYSPSSTRSRSNRRRSSRSRSRHRRSTSTSRRLTRSRSPRRRTPARRTSRSRSRSRRSRSRHRSPRRAAHHDLSPRALRRQLEIDAEATDAINAQYPSIGSSTGKYLPRSRATLEPYRNLPPDLKRRAGERRSRKDLSLPEHLCGLLFMAAKSMDSSTDAHAAVQHAAQVAQDAVNIQWPTVRAWSQSCLAHVEEGGSWHDVQMFKDERFRLC